MAYQVSPGINVSEIDLTTIVPGVATSTAAIAGVFRWGPVNYRTLIGTENDLVSMFGKPSSFNQQTFFTAANFLGYGSALYVVRAANTTDPTNGAYNAMANSNVASVSASVVKNVDDYVNNKDGTFSANVQYVAKYPGALGNSLRISVCDSPNAYSSNLALMGTVNSHAVNGAFSVAVGSNTGTFSFISAYSVSEAQTFAVSVMAGLSKGDLVTVGNSSIGKQLMKVASVGSCLTNASASYAQVTFSDVYKLSTDFAANTTVNGNTTVVNVQRNWEFAGSVDAAPTTSDYVLNYGNTSAVDTLHVVVVDNDGLFTGVTNSVLEVYNKLSRATDAKLATGASNYYKTVINQGSRYVWFASDRSGAASANAVSIVSSSNISPLNLDFVSGQDGYTESTVPVSILASGYDLFASKEDIDIALVLQGRPTGGTTTVAGQTINNFQLANYLIDNIAEVRKDCVVFITPDDDAVKSYTGQEATSLVNWAGALHSSSYAVVDSGYKYMYDRYNDQYIYVPTNGDVAGLCARTEQTNDAWWSPAGFNRGQIKNLVRMRYNPSKAARDVLYKASINPIVTSPGQGTVLYGDKTFTARPSAFDHINVRRLFIVLEKAISQASRFTLFEFNDAFTRAQFVNMVTPYLRDVQARRGITDFLVVCDETNNTPDRIDRNEFWGDIYIKPNRSINFIQLNFVAVSTGVAFSTVVGRF